MVWVEMGSRVADMMVYRGDGVDDGYSPMELELFWRNIMGNFCQEFLAISWLTPYDPLSKVDGTPVL